MEDLLRVAFVVENNLGHRTHLRCLRQWIGEAQGIDPVWVPIEPWEPDLWSRLPVVRHETPLCWSGRAASKLQALAKSGRPPDVVYLHTVNIALAASLIVGRQPTVVSMDTTPEPAQTFAAYRHGAAGARGLKLELREALYRRCFRHASRLVGLSPWVTESLVRHYKVPPDKALTIPSGVDLAFWAAEPATPRERARPRIVFVGGDFQRKGGEPLVRVWRAGLKDVADLTIVSATAPPELQSTDGLTVLKSATPTELRRLFATSTVMALPSQADAVPWVIMEAMAAGLPVVATRVGGIPWMVRDGIDGFVIPPGDEPALLRALRALLDAQRARSFGGEAAAQARRAFDGARNYARLAELLRGEGHARRMAA